MKKIIALALAASAFIIPATASASVSGAERAVRSELRWDYGRKYDGYPSCTQHRRGYYTCWTVLGRGGIDTYDVRARVWQYGSRYVVDYRIDY